jgi:hypothetical protein
MNWAYALRFDLCVLCYAPAGGTDERMMELLEPFRGHRFRIIRLLYAAGLDVPW